MYVLIYLCWTDISCAVSVLLVVTAIFGLMGFPFISYDCSSYIHPTFLAAVTSDYADDSKDARSPAAAVKHDI